MMLPEVIWSPSMARFDIQKIENKGMQSCFTLYAQTRLVLEPPRVESTITAQIDFLSIRL